MGDRVRPAHGLTVREAVPQDAEAFGRRLREEDARECWAAAGLGPVQAVAVGIAQSETCRVAHYGAEPLAVWGVVDDGEWSPGCRAGKVWMLGTPLIRSHKTLFLRRSVSELEGLWRTWGVLWNFADARNSVHLQWLRWLGFEFVAESVVGDFTPGAPVRFKAFIGYSPNV